MRERERESAGPYGGRCGKYRQSQCLCVEHDKFFLCQRMLVLNIIEVQILYIAGTFLCAYQREVQTSFIAGTLL